MANSVLNYIINVVKKGSGDKQTVTALQSVKSVMTGVGIAAGVATTAYIAYDKVIGESTRITVKYADEVRKQMSVSKQNAKETSILIQVADDYKVSSEQLLTATKRLATQGYAMNIETLAKLSDKYKSLGTAQEKQQFLTKNLGKTGQDYITMLEAGGDELLRNADLVNNNLILTERQVQAARDYEIAQDRVNDSKQAYAIALGNQVIPMQVKYLDSLTKVLEGENALKVILGNVLWFTENNVETTDSATQSYTAWAKAIELTKGNTENLGDAQLVTTDSLLGFVDAVEQGGDATKRFLLSSYQASLALREIPAEEAARKILAYEHALGLTSDQVYEANLRMLGLKGSIDALQSKDIFINTYMTTMNLGGPGSEQMSAMAAMSLNPPAGGGGWKFKAGGYGKGPDGKVRYYWNPTTGEYKAKGGYPSDWTVVGEHGKELIDPTGYIHSNAESRRLIAAGVTPFRGLASGGNIGFSEPGEVFNPTVRKTGIASLKTLSQFVAGGGSFTAMADAARGGSSGASASAVQQTVAASQQAAEVNIAAAQSVVSSSQSIQESNVKAVSATQIQTAANTQQNSAILSELRGLRNDIKSIIPKAIGDAYQKVIGT